MTAGILNSLAVSRYILLLAVSLTTLTSGAAEEGAAASEDRFDVWEYRVLGNTVLKPAEIEAAVYPKLGPGRSFADVEEVRKTLEALYRDRGYGTVFVDIPEQDVADGIVRLQITEGRLARVRITGARYFANGHIREALPALERDSVLNLPQLQRQLESVNRQTADRQVTPLLRAGPRPGTVDVELKVKDELPVHGSIDVNDRYTADTTKTRASVNLGYDNLFQRQHRLSFQYQASPEELDESRVVAATYIAPLADSGNLLAVYAVDTKSDFATLGSIGSLSVLGTGRIYGVRYIMMFPQLGGYFHNFTFGADFKDFKDSIVQPEGSPDRTPMKYLTWSSLYSGTLRTQNTLTSFTTGFNFGIRGFSNSPEEFEYKRYKAEANYAYFTANAQHERPLLWGTRVFARVGGQFSSEPLISNEQFAIGGADSVRGYREAEEMGDSGASATLELRSPQLTGWWPDQLQQLYLLSFYDAGVVGIHDPLVNDGERVNRLHLSSWGLGLRLAAFGGLEAALDWAYPLSSIDGVAHGDSRIHFQVRYAF